MIEALACGTPVIARPFGSVPEIVADGTAGFIVPDIDSAADAVERIGEIDRRNCRKHFEQHFSAERMAQNYLDIYKRLRRGKSPAIRIDQGVLSWSNLASSSTTT
jgi:glycosyltransferase involved in cell wall biosynthesis